MKLKRTAIFSLLLMLFLSFSSCSSSNNKHSDTDPDVNPDQDPIPDQDVEEQIMKLETYEGSFEYSEDSATSTSDNNLAVLSNKNLSSGTFKTKIKANGVYNAGIIFASSLYPESYYFLGMNSEEGSKMKLVKYVGGEGIELGSCYVTAGYNKEATIELKVEYFKGEIKCFFDDKMFIYRYDESPLNGQFVGLKSDNNGTEYSAISISKERNFKEYETLIIGHSYMELWSNYKSDLSKFSDIFNIGIGGTATTDWINHRVEIIKYNPKNIIYMIGINDYPRGTSAETIVDNIKQLIDPLLVKLPDTRICLVSVNQCVTHTSYKQEIIKTNALLKTYVSTNERLVYANIDNAFLDESGNPTASCFVDGLHPTEESYKIIAQAIYDAFENENNLRTTLIIGHSYMDNWKENCASDLSNYNNVVNIGVGMTNSLFWTSKIDEIVLYNPLKLIYMTGINDIPHGVENRTLYNHLKKVLVDVRDQISDIEICLLSIPQVPMFYDEYKEKIDEANNYYKKLAVDLDYVFYGDLDNAYLNSDGTPNPDCFSDGLHPLMSEYNVIVKAIDEAFNHVNQPSSDDVFVKVDNIEYQEENVANFINDLKNNNQSLKWEYEESSIKVNKPGFALSSDEYSDFDLVYRADNLTSDNPYFSNDCKKGLVFGAQLNDSFFKGYFISIGQDWIEICYCNGQESYKCNFIDGINFCSSYACIRISIIGKVCNITYGDNIKIGNFFSGSNSVYLENYIGGYIGILNNENTSTAFEFKEIIKHIPTEIDKKQTLLNDFSNTLIKNENNDFTVDVSNNKITTTSNDGYLISNDDYSDFSLGVNISATSAVNPFFDQLAQEAILIGGTYSDGKYTGYAINFDSTSWIEVVYIDGENNNKCTFIDGWNFSFLGKDLVITVNNANVYLSLADGTEIPNTFNGKTSISMDNYSGGKIGVLSYDGEATIYTFNSFMF